MGGWGKGATKLASRYNNKNRDPRRIMVTHKKRLTTKSASQEMRMEAIQGNGFNSQIKNRCHFVLFSKLAPLPALVLASFFKFHFIF